MKSTGPLLAFVVLCSWSALAQAQPSYEIPYQGRLERDGTAVNSGATGDYEFRFKLLDGAGTEIWTETVTAPVYAGTFAVSLGRLNPISGTTLAAATQLAIDVKSPVDLDFVVLQGAQALGSVPLAARAGDFSVGGGVYFDTVGSWYLNGATSPSVAPQMQLSAGGVLTIDDQLMVGSWPASRDYAFVGTAALDQSQHANYALLQHVDGRTYLNSPIALLLRTDNIDRITVDDTTVTIAGQLDVNGGLVTIAGQLDVNGGLRCETRYQYTAGVDSQNQTALFTFPSPADAAELFQYGWICWSRETGDHVTPTTSTVHNQYYTAWGPGPAHVCGRISYLDRNNESILVHPQGDYYFGLRYMNQIRTHGCWSRGPGESCGQSATYDYWSIHVCR